MQYPATSKVTTADNVLVRIIRSEAVLLNLKSEEYLGLNPVGTRMWTVLNESPSIEAAYESLLKEYEVDPETLRSDLEELLDQLVERGLVEVGANGASG